MPNLQDPLEILISRNTSYDNFVSAIIKDPMYRHTAPWWKRGSVCVMLASGKATDIKNIDDGVPVNVARLGCAGHDADGNAHWIGWDFDVGHGAVCYTTFDAALADAMRLREALGEAEIRRSTNGNGVHVRHWLPVDAGLDKADAAKVAKYASRKLGLKSDPSSCGRQVHWLWTRTPTPLSFQQITAQDEPVLDLADVIMEALSGTGENAVVKNASFGQVSADDSIEELAKKSWMPSGSFSGRSPLGERNRNDVMFFANDWGMSISRAIELVKDAGGNPCESAHQWERMFQYCRYPRGWARRKHEKASGVPMAPTTPAAPKADPADDEPMVVRPEFPKSDWDAIDKSLGDEPPSVWIREGAGIGVNVPKGFLLADSIIAGCLYTAKEGVKIIRAAGAPQPTNAYGFKIGKSGQSKGLTSDLLLEMAEKFGVYRLHGKSEAAIITNCVKAMETQSHCSVGLHYVSEIAKFLDPKNPVSNAMSHFWLEAFDQGYADWSTKNSNQHLDEFNPTCLFLGQPSVLEEIIGARAAVKTGFVPRCLMVCDESAWTDGSPRGCDRNAILAAYQRYRTGNGNKLVSVAYHDPECNMTDYKPYFNDFEMSVWKRLRFHYAPRIAILLHPEAIAAGAVTPAMLDRTGPILDFFFAQAQKVGFLLHDDKGEMMRSKFERYVSQHEGCSQRDILRNIHMSLREFADVSASVVARGGAHQKAVSTTSRQKIGWYSGPKGGTITQLSQACRKPILTDNPVGSKGIAYCHNKTYSNSKVKVSTGTPIYNAATEKIIMEPSNPIDDNCHNESETDLRQLPAAPFGTEDYSELPKLAEDPKENEWQHHWLSIWMQMRDVGKEHEYSRLRIKAEMNRMEDRFKIGEEMVLKNHDFLTLIEYCNGVVGDDPFKDM